MLFIYIYIYMHTYIYNIWYLYIYMYMYIRTYIHYISIAYNLWIPLAGFGRPIGPGPLWSWEARARFRFDKHGMLGEGPKKWNFSKSGESTALLAVFDRRWPFFSIHWTFIMKKDEEFHSNHTIRKINENHWKPHGVMDYRKMISNHANHRSS